MKGVPFLCLPIHLWFLFYFDFLWRLCFPGFASFSELYGGTGYGVTGWISINSGILGGGKLQ